MVEKYTDEYIQQQKERFIEEFFQYEIRNYHEDDKFINKLVDIRYEPVENIPRTLVFTHYNQLKYSFNDNWEEFISVIIILVAEAVNDFHTKHKKFDWSTLNVAESKSNVYLKSHITNRLKQRLVDESRRAQNQTYGQMTVEEDGEKVRYRTIIDMDQQSTDAVIDDGERNKTSIINTLEGSNKYGYQNSLYHPNHFLKFFHETKEDILTEGQKVFIEDMPKFLHEVGDNYTIPYADDPNQKFNVNQQGGNRRQIRLRTMKRYEKEFPDGHEITLLQMKKENDLQLLNELLDIAYNEDADDLSVQNTYISNWIHEHLNSDSNMLVSDLLHDRLTTDELIHMNVSLHNGYAINSKLIYKIIGLVEVKIQQLKKFDTSNGGRAKGNSGWTKEDHQAYRDYLHRINNKEIEVYDLKTGKLIGTEEVKREGKNYKVLRLNTYGMRHEVGEHDVGVD